MVATCVRVSRPEVCAVLYDDNPLSLTEALFYIHFILKIFIIELRIT